MTKKNPHRIANRSGTTYEGCKSRVAERVETTGAPFCSFARRNGGSELAPHFRLVPAAPPADTDRLPPQGNYERARPGLVSREVSDKKPRLNANATAARAVTR